MIDPTIMIIQGDYEEDIDPPYNQEEFIIFKGKYSKLPFPLFELEIPELEDELFHQYGGGWYRVIMFDSSGIRPLYSGYV